MSERITLEQVEQLAAEVETQDQAERARLRRLIAAEARILAVREPDKFPRRKVELSDEDGHWDNSYPPEIAWKDPSGPRLYRVRKGDYETVATEAGFYHAWRAVTSDRGLYVARDGRIYGQSYEGAGRVGQFAAHPGSCGVQITVSYDQTDSEDLTIEDLQAVESDLREIVFPLASARQAAQQSL